MKRPNGDLIAAVICAPFIGSLLGFLAFGAWVSRHALTNLNAIIDVVRLSLQFTMFFGGPIGIAATIALGLPIHALLVRKTAAAMWIYAASGALVGIVTSVVVAAMFGLSHTALGSTLSYGIVFGALIASVFWLIRRPDREMNARVVPDMPPA